MPGKQDLVCQSFSQSVSHQVLEGSQPRDWFASPSCLFSQRPFFFPGDNSRPAQRRKPGDNHDMATRPTTEIERTKNEPWVTFYVRVICIQITSTSFIVAACSCFFMVTTSMSPATRVFHAECSSAVARDAPSSDGFLTLASICHEPHWRQSSIFHP